jgi:Phage portal protein
VRLLDALLPARQVTRYTPPQWMDPFINGFGGGYNGSPIPGYMTTYGVDRAEPISNCFTDYVLAGLQGNGVIWSVERVRMSVFSEARFQFQRFNGGRPGDLWGDQSLQLLEQPWVGGTTGDLLARMILDADAAGNFFAVELDGEVVRLRPDWVEIVMTERYDAEGRQVGWKRLGYLYFQDGKTGDDPAVFLPEEVVHFAPYPDPLANWRGMSWITPVVREVQADTQATKHKLKFFENAATPNLAVSLPKEITPDTFTKFVAKMEAAHAGADNAYKTLYTGGGADVTVVGADMKQLDFKITQGAGESRIAAAGGIHPTIAGLSEGLQGSSLNAGNFGAARRLVSDGTLRPLWRNAAGSLQVLTPAPPGSRLWYDAQDVAFLREDAKDAAEITEIQARTIANLVKEGFTAESAKAAVLAQNMDLLVHTGLVSVQLQPPTSRIDEQSGATVSAPVPPGSPAAAPVAASPTRPALPAANGSGG